MRSRSGSRGASKRHCRAARPPGLSTGSYESRSPVAKRPPSIGMLGASVASAPETAGVAPYAYPRHRRQSMRLRTPQRALRDVSGDGELAY